MVFLLLDARALLDRPRQNRLGAFGKTAHRHSGAALVGADRARGAAQRPVLLRGTVHRGRGERDGAAAADGVGRDVGLVEAAEAVDRDARAPRLGAGARASSHRHGVAALGGERDGRLGRADGVDIVRSNLDAVNLPYGRHAAVVGD